MKLLKRKRKRRNSRHWVFLPCVAFPQPLLTHFHYNGQWQHLLAPPFPAPFTISKPCSQNSQSGCAIRALLLAWLCSLMYCQCLNVFISSVYPASWSSLRKAQEVFRKNWSQLTSFENTIFTVLYRNGAIYNYFWQNAPLCPTEPEETNEVLLKCFFYCFGDLRSFELDMRN